MTKENLYSPRTGAVRWKLYSRCFQSCTYAGRQHGGLEIFLLDEDVERSWVLADASCESRGCIQSTSRYELAEFCVRRTVGLIVDDCNFCFIEAGVGDDNTVVSVELVQIDLRPSELAVSYDPCIRSRSEWCSSDVAYLFKAMLPGWHSGAVRESPLQLCHLDLHSYPRREESAPRV